MKKYDIVVVGGGIAGVAAAVAAGREGMKTLLVEKFGSLGGTMSAGLVYPFMKNHLPSNGFELSQGLFAEMKKRHAAYGDASWELYKMVFDDMCMEAGVDVLFHSTVFEAKTDGRKITGVCIATKAGVLDVEADFFVDASGDGELMFMTGCDYQLGREEDNFCQPMTACFRVGNVDVDLFKQEKPMLQEKYKEAQQVGKIKNPRENILTFLRVSEGVVHFNTTRIIKLNPVDPFDVSRAEMIARQQTTEMMAFLREHGKSFQNCNLIGCTHHIGVRESRKLKGEHILTVEELMNSVSFPDTIAVGNYKIDIHSPTGTGTEIIYLEGDNYYQIPYRCLLPKEYDNMLVAGRNVSADHRAHSAVRIMPICACMGEAAGVALALAKKSGKDARTVDIQAVRQTLKDKGAVVEL